MPLGDRVLVQQTPDVEQFVKIYFELGSMSSLIELKLTKNILKLLDLNSAILSPDLFLTSWTVSLT